MRLNEFIEQKELEQLEEGPILNKIGSAVGNVAGTVAKGVGAVAGGIAGLGGAFKKGFQAGKTTVAGGGDDPATGTGTGGAASTGGSTPTAGSSATPAASGSGGTAPAAQTQTLANPKTPAATSSGATQPPAAGGQPAAQEKPAAGASAQPAAEKPAADADQEKPAAAGTPQTGTMKGAPGKPGFTGVPERPGAADSQGRKEPTMGATAPANDPEFQKVQQNIGKLPPEQQKELMAALMADPEVKKALEQPAPAADAEQQPAAAPAAQPEAPAAADQVAAKPGRQRDARGRFIGKNAPRSDAAPSQATIDADREKLLPQTGESKKILKNIVVENPQIQPTVPAKVGHMDKMAAMSRGLEKGLANPMAILTGKEKEVSDTSTDIVDTSGTMPVTLINKINSLEDSDKIDLYVALKRKLRR